MSGAATQDIDKLVARVNRMAAGNPYESGDFLRSVSDTLATLTKRLEEAEAVIRPFARASDKLHTGYDAGIAAGDHPMSHVFVADLRAAAHWMEGK